MCGVFSFISYDGRGPSIERLEKIAVATESRGPDAFGFAWIDALGRLRMYKRAGRISHHLGLLSLMEDAQFIVGHCRYATQGDPVDNINNHPHPADGGWVVHNGVIRNYDRIVDAKGLAPVTQCDSEVLGLLIERNAGTLRQRCVKAVRKACDGPLVMLGLWSRPARLLALRMGNPLHVGEIKGGERYYLGSLAAGLPGETWSVADGTGLEFTVAGAKAIRIGKRKEAGHELF